MKFRNRKSERGVFLITVAMSMLILLGIIGLAVDLGGLFVAKTELQSAMDSCALAAAQELNGMSDAIVRAKNAGITAGNSNKVRYQSASASLISSDITFSDSLSGAFSSGFIPATGARYARCTHTIVGIPTFIIHMLGVSAKNDVFAIATATTSPAQTNCPIPLGLRPKSGGTASNNYGFQHGEWVNILFDSSKQPAPGEVGWYNLNIASGNPNSAQELLNELQFGYCKSAIGNKVGTPGVKAVADDLWNSRFGIYKNKGAPTVIGMTPDFTGYAYTSVNWNTGQYPNAYDGTPPSPTKSDPNVANFKTQRANFVTYGGTAGTISAGDKITGIKTPGGYKDDSTGGPSGTLEQYGGNRRIVLAAVVDSSSTVIDYVCMLMLQPYSSSTVPIQMEFIGLGGALGSPCIANGLPGGTAGPLVPVLVQ